MTLTDGTASIRPFQLLVSRGLEYLEKRKDADNVMCMA
jgi:hypothetical protein